MDEDELPVGIILVKSAVDFCDICSMCADFQYDVLELYIDGHHALVFYDILELEVTVLYCQRHAYDHMKYVCTF